MALAQQPIKLEDTQKNAGEQYICSTTHHSLVSSWNMTTTGSHGQSDSNNGEGNKSQTQDIDLLSQVSSYLEILAVFKVTVRKTKAVIALVQIKWLPQLHTMDEFW